MAPQWEHVRRCSAGQSRRQRHCCSSCLMAWCWVTLLEDPRRCHRTSRQAQWLIRSHCQLYHCVAAYAAVEALDDDFDRWFTNNIDSRYRVICLIILVWKNKTIYQPKPVGAQNVCRPGCWVHHAPADSDLRHTFAVISSVIIQQLRLCRTKNEMQDRRQDVFIAAHRA